MEEKYYCPEGGSINHVNGGPVCSLCIHIILGPFH